MDLRTIRGARGEGGDIRNELRNEAAARARMEAVKARARASEEGTVVKHRLGETMLDLMEDYFPQETAARRRKDMAQAFAAGVAVGLAATYVWKGR